VEGSIHGNPFYGLSVNISLLTMRSWNSSAQKRTAGGQKKLPDIMTKREQELKFLCTLSLPCPVSDVKIQRVTL
jgi:hypothetical protein